MKILHSIAEMKTTALKLKQNRKSIGFVPTMGALHAGHRSLFQRARHENDQFVVSVFVNPLQFGPKEDFKRYPRNVKQDLKILKEEKVDVVFVPSASEMFPHGFSTSVDVAGLTSTLCGPFRPGHFRGVATVVAKLFEIVQPTRAYFGAKDYQQGRVIQRMVQDLQMSVRVIACPTVRESDGLACSSRNRGLSPQAREEAIKLYQALYLGRELVEQKIMKESKQLEKRLRGILARIPKSRIDYVSVVDPVSLAPMHKIHRPGVASGRSMDW